MIVYISDFDMIGSGYMQLSIALCRELAERGYKVTALGIGYQGAEHNWPFSIIPVRQSQSMMVIRAMWQNLLYLAQSGQHDQIEAVVVALDIPYQARIQEMMQGPMRKPMVGIFPVESGPLISSWAAPVAGAHGRKWERDADDAILKKMESEKKIQIHEFKDRARILELAAPVKEAFAKEVGAEKVLAAINAVR